VFEDAHQPAGLDVSFGMLIQHPDDAAPGRGIRQFADGTPLDLALIETRQFDGGIVLLRYRTATR